MNQRIIQLPRNLETLFKMVGLPFFQFKGQRQTTSRPLLLFLLIVHARPLPFQCFSTPLYRIFRTFSSKNSKFDIQPLFFTVQRFLHLSPSPIYPPFHSSRSENVLNCEKISLKSCQPLDKSLTICYTVLVTPTNTDIPRSRAHPRRTDEA